MDTEDEEHLPQMELDFYNGKRNIQDENSDELSQEVNMDEINLDNANQIKQQPTGNFQNLLAQEVENLKQELSRRSKNNQATTSSCDPNSTLLSKEVYDLMHELKNTKKSLKTEVTSLRPLPYFVRKHLNSF